MQNATVREYTRRCNTVENSYRSVKPSYLRPRDRGNYKESAACPITKVSNCSQFHIPQFFCSLLSQLSSMRDFFFFLIHFLFFRETEAIIRKVPLVRSPKQVIVLIFVFLECFLFSSFQAMQYQRFFSPFDTFSHVRNFTYAFSVELLYHKDRDMFCPLNKVQPCCAWLVLGWVTKYEYSML